MGRAMKLTLEALQAADGDCLLLHYERKGATTRVLVDGGSRGIYSKVLRKRLDELRGDAPLDLRMLMVSHIDGDHVTGLVDMFRAMTREDEDTGEPFCRIRTLWFNSFEQLTGGKAAAVQSAVVGAALNGVVPAGLEPWTKAVVASVQQGHDLRNFATQLGIPFNQGAGGELVKAPKAGVKKVKIAEGLTFSVLGPNDAQLEALDDEWQKAKLKPTPSAQAADFLNRTVPNLSSIVVLVEAERGGGKTPISLLLTGDAGGDHVLESLKRGGLSTDGSFRVNLLKVMHHGSNHSVDQDFFERVVADHYVISGNGKHGIPHRDTLKWLSAARTGKPYDVYLTNRKGAEGLTAMLTTFLKKEKQKEPKHKYHFRAEKDLSIAIEFS
jgi:beta-lactamase superfamily II metal-dependent hydrolase